MSRPLTLAVDLDGVLADYTGAMRRVGGIAPSAPDPVTYTMRGPDNPGWFPDKAAWLAAHEQVTRNLRDLDLLDPSAPETLRALSAEGTHLVYLTAREPVPGADAEKIVADTRAWLDDAGFPDAGNTVADPDKAGYLRSVGFDALLDDAPHNAETVRAAGGVVIVRDQPYNRHVPGSRSLSVGEYAEQTVGSAEFRDAAARRRAGLADDRLRATPTHVFRSLDGYRWQAHPRRGRGGWTDVPQLPPSAARVPSAVVADALGGRCVACGREIRDATRFGGYGPECVRRFA
jgi:hypothetical protein